MKKYIFFVFIILLFCYFFYFNKPNIYKVLDKTEDISVNVDSYYIYGNHFNLHGNININEEVSDVKLVLASLDNEISYDVIYSLDGDNLSFNISDLINEGIYLDEIPIDKYFLLLKVKYGNDIKYYNLKNNTDYNNLIYYTITRNNSNNEIKINFDKNKNKDFMFFDVSKTNKDDFVDIVIDAGHGGDDPGAVNDDYYESNITLDYALELKESLEELGLKVKLTREDDISIPTYGSNSRTSIPHDFKAKYVFSIHLNSFPDINYGGVEIYSPNKADLSFASNLASNIVLNANTTYSKNQSFKEDDGVYVRTFNDDDIEESIETAEYFGYKPYYVDNETNYYFIIRETGGIVTGAYTDGRNKNYDKNLYYDSNIGVEGYLFELGYINYEDDINNLLNNKKGYIKGITESIKKELNL